MFSFIKRKCCTEFTQWETYKATYTKPHNTLDEKIIAGTKCITYTKRWQERKCTICGKIQQRELDF